MVMHTLTVPYPDTILLSLKESPETFEAARLPGGEANELGSIHWHCGNAGWHESRGVHACA
jgi:hypothetical protein